MLIKITIRNIINILLFVSILIVVILLLLLVNGYSIDVLHSKKIILFSFIAINIIYLIYEKDTEMKLLVIYITVPLMIFSALIIFWNTNLYEIRYNKNLKITVNEPVFLSCGETIEISEKKFGIFYKKIYYDKSVCLTGIYKIIILNYEKNFGEFLIYHDGKMTTFNPDEYYVNIKNFIK